MRDWYDLLQAEVSVVFSCSGLVSEKKNEQLFFVQSEVTPDGRRLLSRAERRKRPLRSLCHLYHPVISNPNKTVAGLQGSEGEVEASAESEVWPDGSGSEGESGGILLGPAEMEIDIQTKPTLTSFVSNDESTYKRNGVPSKFLML